MVHVDLICSSEYLPRVKLLVNHLALQKIRIRIRDKLPAKPTDRIIVLPAHLDEIEVPDGIEVVALYFDKPESGFSSDEAFHIPTWPARSSDHQVNELAALLKRPVRKTTQKDSSSDKAHPKKKGDPANRVALLTICIVAAVFYFSSGNSNQTREEETPTDESRLVEHEGEVYEMEFVRQASGEDLVISEGIVASPAVTPRIDAILISSAQMECFSVPFEPKFDLPLPSALAPSHAWCPAPPRCAVL